MFSFPDRFVDASSLTLPFMTTELMGGSLVYHSRYKESQNIYIDEPPVFLSHLTAVVRIIKITRYMVYQ